MDYIRLGSTGRNEEVVAKNLLKMTAREHLVLATKVFYPMSEAPNDRGLSRKHITAAIDRSLQRMGTDYVDLYVIHAFDTDTPVEETMEALHDTVRAGKVRYLGGHAMYAWQFAKMNHVAAIRGWTPFVNMPCQYNVLYREEERAHILRNVEAISRLIGRRPAGWYTGRPSPNTLSREARADPA
jgi:aryl-alcohol dehydrogenase-like predicted oxidoreductase